MSKGLGHKKMAEDSKKIKAENEKLKTTSLLI